MDATQFIYWLQGAIELGKMTKMDEEQVKILNNHIALVMTKVTVTYPASPLVFPGDVIAPQYNPPMPVYPWSPQNPFGDGQIICQGTTGGGGIASTTQLPPGSIQATFTADSQASMLECAKEPDMLDMIKAEMEKASLSKIDKQIFGDDGGFPTFARQTGRGYALC